MPYADPEKARACWRRYRQRNLLACRERVRIATKKWAERHPEKVKEYQRNRVRPKYSQELYAKTRESRLKSVKKHKIKSKYGLKWEDYLRMVRDSDGLCAICGRQWGERGPCIDHDHMTGRIRGLLCNACNICLYSLEIDRTWAKKAIAYLDRR